MASDAVKRLRKNKNIFAVPGAVLMIGRMVIEHAPLEDELGDVLEKAMRLAGLDEPGLARRAEVPLERIRDAFDYRYDFVPGEVQRLARALALNEVGLVALAAGRYPLPALAGLPFCLYPLRTPHGIGVANAYIVADCSKSTGVLFDTGSDPAVLRRVWPPAIKRIEAVFITHAETEHLAGLDDVIRQFGPMPIFGPAGAVLGGAVLLEEGARLRFGGFEIETLATPGHAEAHNCYVVRVPRAPAGMPLLISGDLLFAGSVGGAYFCAKRLGEQVRRLFAQLPASTAVAPGHGPLTTLENERNYNPFVS